MRTLSISGGGAKGAYAGGIVELLKESGKDWDFYTGTSTGALIIPMVACDEIPNLKKAYTNITSEKIFKINPFRIKKVRNGVARFGINHINIARNLIINKSNSLGDSSNLRKTIEEFLSKDNYDQIRESGKDVLVSVCNLSLEQVEFKSILSEEYSDFMDWMWASGSATPFMSVVEKNGYEYADGGLLRFIPIQEAIERGSTEIDAIVLMEESNGGNHEKIRNVLHLITKVVKILLTGRKKEDSDLSKLHKMIDDDREIKLNIYFTPNKLTNNPYIFDSVSMNNWWNQGYESAKAGPTHEYILTRRKVVKLK